MPRFGLVGPSYEAQSPNLDAQRCVNWYPEVDESGAGNSPIALLPTPGTRSFADLSPLPPCVGNPAAALDNTLSVPVYGTQVYTYTGAPIAGPSTVLIPYSSNWNGLPPEPGIISPLSIVDSLGNLATLVYGPLRYNDPLGPTENPCRIWLYAINVAGVIPTNYAITITSRVFGSPGMPNDNVAVLFPVIFSKVRGIDQFAAVVSALQILNGVPLTTTGNRVLVVITSNVYAPATPPAGTVQAYTTGSTPGGRVAVYSNSGLFSIPQIMPAGTYSPFYDLLVPQGRNWVMSFVALRTC